jgi:hypothetical protein
MGSLRGDADITLRRVLQDALRIAKAAVRAAEGALLEDRPVRISEEGFAAFLAAIMAPAEASPEMVAILKRRAPWDASPSDEDLAAELRAVTSRRRQTPSEDLLREGRDER